MHYNSVHPKLITKYCMLHMHTVDVALMKLYELITLQTKIVFRHRKYKRCSK